MQKSKLRMDRLCGGSVELCALSILTGLDTVVYFKGGYHKFGKTNLNNASFYITVDIIMKLYFNHNLAILFCNQQY